MTVEKRDVPGPGPVMSGGVVVVVPVVAGGRSKVGFEALLLTGCSDGFSPGADADLAY